MVKAVQSNPITSIFSSTDSQPGDAEKDRIRPPAEERSASTAAVPETVLWHMLFIFANNAGDEAAKAGAGSGEAGLWRDYFTRQAKLSAQDDSKLKDIAGRFEREIEPLDARARTIIERARARLESKPNAPRQAPPEELAKLQKQREETALRYRDEFKNMVGEEAFADFSAFLAGAISPEPTRGGPQVISIVTVYPTWQFGARRTESGM
jgi:hypothetical protein